jgi:hypothetical protein
MQKLKCSNITNTDTYRLYVTTYFSKGNMCKKFVHNKYKNIKKHLVKPIMLLIKFECHNIAPSLKEPFRAKMTGICCIR